MTDKPVVAVTGASKGIGAAASVLFAKRDFHVVLIARHENPLHEIADQIQDAGGDALVVPTDITQWEQVQALREKTMAHFGRIDVLVNNAGGVRFAALGALKPDDILENIMLNLVGTMYCTKVFTGPMRRAGGGRVINVSSMAGKRGYPGSTHYCAAKHGLTGFAKAYQHEVRDAGIFVTTLYPGRVDTPFWKNRDFAMDPKICLQAEDVADAIVQAATCRASAIQQEVILIHPSEFDKF